MLIGYERVSTDDQKLALQHDALQAAGCIKIFSDKLSGAQADRPGLKKAFDFARGGDTLIVWRLDRLGRSLKDLIALVEELESRTIGLRRSKRTSIQPPVAESSSFTCLVHWLRLSGT